MQDDRIEAIVQCMALSGEDSTIQRIQTQHRIKLAEFWNIKPGSRVLEIGCGQGDTTAVLAYLVGEEGFVQGVDIAPPDYGSPITVGEAAAHLAKSRLGKRMRMDFETDVLSPDVDFPEQYFDFVVLSHCSWYFKSFEQISEVLARTRKWAKHLCFAEWDTRITAIEQLPHFLAVLIQSQVECFKETSLSNVRTLLTPDDAARLAENAGWRMIKEGMIHSPELQDGRWESDMTLANYPVDLDEISGIPPKFKSLIQSQADLLKAAARNSRPVQSMPTSLFIAR